MLQDDDDTLKLVFRFCAALELERARRTSKHFAKLIPQVYAAIAMDEGYILADETRSACSLYHKVIRRRPGIEVTWGRDVEAASALAGLCHVEGLMSNKTRIFCTRLEECETELEYLGEKWSLRVEKRGVMRKRNANYGQDPMPDDDELCLELALIPQSKCYPNCNCRYFGQCHVFALVHRRDRRGEEDLFYVTKSFSITGCYTYAALSDERWHEIRREQCKQHHQQQLGRVNTSSTHPFIIGVQCSSGWPSAYEY